MLRLDPAPCKALSCCAAREEACIPLQQPRKGGGLQRPWPWEPPPQANRVLNEHTLLECRGGAVWGG